jgi:hypothetical protein
MIDKNHPNLSVGTQCRLLSISRSSFYYELMGETAMNLDLMVVIDKQFLETPFYAAYALDAALPEARYPLPGNTCLHV